MQAGERTKILDFGIAKVVDPEAGEVMKTTTGAIVGTPIYMSPEQCRGGIAVTDRTDVYSLGIILYQMLSGSPPFSGTGAGDLIAQHIVDPPKPLHEVAPHIATEVEALVHKMLAKKPEDRPSMKQILGELEQLGLGSTGTGAQVVIVQPPPQPPALRSPLPMVATVGALVFAGLTAFVVTLLVQKSPPALPVHSTAAAAVPERPAKTIEPPAKVQIALRSEPAGAQVLQVSDQSLLGKTPWLVERSRGGPPIKVLLRLSGHAEQTLVIELGDNYDRTVQLAPTPSAAAVDKTNESVKPPTTKPITKPPAKPVQRAVNKPAGKPRQDPVDDIPVVR